MTRPSRVLLLNWRDTGHPQGGGSEHYVEHVAFGLAERGYQVTVCCSAYAGAPADETVRGVRFRRRGNDLTVYFSALLFLLTHSFDLVVDVQNGLPFFSPLVTRGPVVVLVHHLHREQWRIVFGPFVGRVGWWIESWLAPRAYRRCRYVTVSEATRRGLADLGVEPARVSVIHNGLDPVVVGAGTGPASDLAAGRAAGPAVGPASPAPQPAAEPLLVAVSRLAPHKRLEHAVEAVARLRPRWPGLRLEIVGQGPWLENLREYAAQREVSDAVVLHGWLDEVAKHDALARAWVHLCPSVKEGWGIVIMEAAAHGVPTVAYRSAGGVTESVRDGSTGLLADNLDDFVARVAALLESAALREAMRGACLARATVYGWAETVDAFEALVTSLCRPSRRVSRRPSRM